jgi:hypothetical protein
MPCEIMTEGVFKAALRRELSPEQRAAVLRHLREPCEACLDFFEGHTAEEMMLTAEQQLSPKEREGLFVSAVMATEPTARTGRLRVGRRPWQPRLALGAMAALAVVALVTTVRAGRHQFGGGVKGTAAPTAALIPLVGASMPTPHVVRALAPGGSLAPGELLLLRIRLDAPAWVYLLSQKQGEAAELLWPRPGTARHAPGEFELAESGAALAISPGALGIGGQLLLIASPAPLSEGRLRVEPVHTRKELQRAFPGCGVDLLPIAVEPH